MAIRSSSGIQGFRNGGNTRCSSGKRSARRHARPRFVPACDIGSMVWRCCRVIKHTGRVFLWFAATLSNNIWTLLHLRDPAEPQCSSASTSGRNRLIRSSMMRAALLLSARPVVLRPQSTRRSRPSSTTKPTPRLNGSIPSTLLMGDFVMDQSRFAANVVFDSTMDRRRTTLRSIREVGVSFARAFSNCLARAWTA
jgi:hypothetical protein